MLFSSIVYGPIHSRRLGTSLGINLMPTEQKLCSFDCIYCECGLNKPWHSKPSLPTLEQYQAALTDAATRLRSEDIKLDVITFSGNGEPTLHPDFERIMQATAVWRDKFQPNAKICVLSNSTQLHRNDVVRGLMIADKRILKLDAGIDATIRLIDNPAQIKFTAKDICDRLEQFNGDFTLQTCFLRGTVNGTLIDNTTETEVTAWLECVERLMPHEVMIYVIDRKTPYDTLQKIPREQMEAIAARVRTLGIPVSVSA
ncbi:MAG TPA: radical SAM protein [Bacteroidales bacterium]|nr:radical SAM protein [Bacteroidales bacterium]